MEATFLEFIRYNNWANEQLLATCAQLDATELETPIPGALGTIRETLEHIVRAEASYVGRLTGSRPQPAFDWAAGPSLTEINEFAAQVAAALVDVAAHVDPTARIRLTFDGRPIDFEARAIFIQIINHGIEHRTNITTVLNQGGQDVPEVDGWSYLMANPERFGLQ